MKVRSNPGTRGGRLLYLGRDELSPSNEMDAPATIVVLYEQNTAPRSGLALRGKCGGLVKCPQKRTLIAILSFMMWPKRRTSRKRLWRKSDSSREQENAFSFRNADREIGIPIPSWLSSISSATIRLRGNHPDRYREASAGSPYTSKHRSRNF